jgi:hypothetical protein
VGEREHLETQHHAALLLRAATVITTLASVTTDRTWICPALARLTTPVLQMGWGSCAQRATLGPSGTIDASPCPACMPSCSRPAHPCWPIACSDCLWLAKDSDHAGQTLAKIHTRAFTTLTASFMHVGHAGSLWPRAGRQRAITWRVNPHLLRTTVGAVATSWLVFALRRLVDVAEHPASSTRHAAMHTRLAMERITPPCV